MGVTLRQVLPLIVIAVLIIYKDIVMAPSCKVVHRADHTEGHMDEDDLTVMMVTNLLLGSEPGYLNIFFGDYYLSKFFRMIEHHDKGSSSCFRLQNPYF